MRNLIFLFILISVLFACDASEDHDLVSVVDETAKVQEEVEEQVIDTVEKLKESIITNMNVVEKLTSYGEENAETIVLMKTTYGNMKIRLYNETPLHRANFIMLAKKKYFDSTLFYRVIPNFMIQGGNTDDDEITTKMTAIGAYRIPNEINPKFAHVKGAIAMAVSPEEQEFEKKSSAFNFYIVEGQKLSNRYLEEIEEREITITKTNKNRYLNKGGAPHLDGNYTVFGEVISGFSVLKKISNVKTEQGDWPVKSIYISTVEVIK